MCLKKTRRKEMESAESSVNVVGVLKVFTVLGLMAVMTIGLGVLTDNMDLGILLRYYTFTS